MPPISGETLLAQHTGLSNSPRRPRSVGRAVSGAVRSLWLEAFKQRLQKSTAGLQKSFQAGMGHRPGRLRAAVILPGLLSPLKAGFGFASSGRCGRSCSAVALRSQNLEIVFGRWSAECRRRGVWLQAQPASGTQFGNDSRTGLGLTFLRTSTFRFYFHHRSE